MLGYKYNATRQYGTTGSYHLVITLGAEPLRLFCGIITMANDIGTKYQIWKYQKIPVKH